MGLTYIQIGSWNIKHLGSQPTEDQRSQSVYALTDHIEMAGVDVLAIQEVYDTSFGSYRNEHLDQTCALLHEHTGYEWMYALLPNRDPEDNSQLCGYLWNNSLIQLDKAEAIPVDFKKGDLWLWDRRPHAVKFTTRNEIMGKQRSFVTVALHMKANTGGSKDREKRTLEAAELVKNVPWIIEKMEDESLILLGDTNILGSWEKAAELIVEAGFNDLNSEDSPTYAGGKAPFDRIFVRDGRVEFKYSRQYVLRSSNESAHLGYLSDHYLVKTSIKIYVDDN